MTNCQHCGAEPMEDQSGPAEEWCSCSGAQTVYVVNRSLRLREDIMSIQDKQASVVNALIAQGMDFLLTRPNAAPTNPPTIVLHGPISGRIVLVYWDGATYESPLNVDEWRSEEHWPLPVVSAS